MTRRRPLVATDRAALMLQLVPYLIGKGEVSIAEAADEFDVTPDADARDGREAHRDRPARRRRLLADGRTSCSTSTGTCSTSATSSSSPTRSASSARPSSPRARRRRCSTGLQLARTIPGVGDTDLFAGLLAKLARGASSTPADVIVAPGPGRRGARSRSPRRCSARVAVSFTYKAPDAAPTTRTVDPVKVHIADGQWYLQGWCHLRQAMRTFHLDRVSDLELTDIPITHARGAGSRMVRRRTPATSSRASASRSPSRRCSATTSTAPPSRRADGVVDRDDARRRRAQPAPPRGAPRRRRRDPRARRRRAVRRPTGPKRDSRSTAEAP